MYGSESDFTPDAAEMQKLMLQKAQELFSICDVESKGFISKLDMQRLQKELPLTPEQLETVFESLDLDKNGFLTEDEFTSGFATVLGLNGNGSTDNTASQDSAELLSDPHMTRSSTVPSGYSGAPKLEDTRGQLSVGDPEPQFNVVLDEIGADGVFDDQETVQALWERLKVESPDLLPYFEKFLGKVTHDIKRTQSDFNNLEQILNSRRSEHDQQVRKLYEEMEHQIRQEREKIMIDEREREKQHRAEMESKVDDKDRQLTELIQKQANLERKLQALSEARSETELENERLAQEKHDLEEMLDTTTYDLRDAKHQLNIMRDKQKSERRERAMAHIQMSEGIAVERESLVKQLGMLRNMNKQLRDDQDIIHAQQIDPRERSRGSVLGLGAYASELNRTGSLSPRDRESSIEEDDFDPDLPDAGAFSASSHGHPNSSPLHIDIRNSASGDERHGGAAACDLHSSTSPRMAPLGSSASSVGDNLTAPERVFKVVFVGDSGVGKSSFIHRFCHDKFRPSFNATIGVDFQVKSIVVDGKCIALQLWDTAGQERFRSITKQYFRKADGIVLMYDVTSETSFTNLREWIESAKENAEDHTVCMILGNKVELCEDENCRVIKHKHAAQLADEYGSLFFEVSACSGHNVMDSINAMSSLLQEKENEVIEKSVRLTGEPKNKSCCN